MEGFFDSRQARSLVRNLMIRIGETTDENEITELAKQVYEFIKTSPEEFLPAFSDNIDSLFKHLNAETYETKVAVINILEIIIKFNNYDFTEYIKVASIVRNICNSIKPSEDNPVTPDIQCKLINILILLD